MPTYNEFTIVMDPTKVDGLARDVTSFFARQEDQYSVGAIQAKSIASGFDLVQQTTFLNYPDQATERARILDAKTDSANEDLISTENIYGKASRLSTEREKVIESYRANSHKDACRMERLVLDIDGERLEISHVSEDVAKKFNTDKVNVTMDMIVDYIQDEYKVAVSSEQRNFLRTQWNQASLHGFSSSLTQTGIRDSKGNPSAIADMDKPHYSIFSFKNGKLQTVEDISFSRGYGELESKTGTSNVMADISNLIGEKSTSTDADWLPRVSPKTVSIKYKSEDGLSCAIEPEIDKAIKKHAKFKAPLFPYFNKIVSKFKKYFSKQGQSKNKSLKVLKQVDHPKGKVRSSSFISPPSITLPNMNFLKRKQNGKIR